MPKIGLIALPGAQLGGLGAMLDLFDLANRYTLAQYEAVDQVNRPSETRLLTEHGEPCRSAGNRMLAADGAWADAGVLDLVYVGGFDVADDAALEQRLAHGAPLIAWLAAQRARGALIAASGPAVFYLAEAGSLRDSVATVPWWLERLFKRRYPDVVVDISRVVAEGEGVMCANSVRGEPALGVRLAEKVLSPNVANWLAKTTLIDPYPDGPAPRSVFSPRVLREDGLVGRAQHWLQQRFSQKARMSELADYLRVSERTLERRFKASLAMSPHEYLQVLRIEAAKQMLARSNRRVERVAYLVGYSDATFFKHVFRDQTGLSPSAFRRQAASAR